MPNSNYFFFVDASQSASSAIGYLSFINASEMAAAASYGIMQFIRDEQARRTTSI
jgi:hypothetical protein